jgi:hypothetical protein
MRIVVLMNDGNLYHIEPEDHDQFINDETGRYGAIPSFFPGFLMTENGQVADEPTSLLGRDVMKVMYT